MSTETYRHAHTRTGHDAAGGGDRSIGAVGLVGVVALVIAALWVGLYFLMLSRS